jgi:sugar phosphate isomerase/epimerase
MHVRIGVPIWPGTRRLAEVLAQAWNMGADYVEISLDYPWMNGLRLDEEKAVRRAVREWGFQVGIHGPWRDVALASPLEEVWEASLKLYREKVVKVASTLEAEYVNIHVSTEENVEDASVRDVALDKGIEAVRLLAEETWSIGAELTVENVPRKLCSTVDDVSRILDSVPRARFCLDVGHALASYLWRNRDPGLRHEILEHWVSALGSKVYLLHLHDIKLNEGRITEHIPLGTGILGEEELVFLAERLSPSYILLEVFRTPEGKRSNSVEGDIGRVRKIFAGG